MPKACLIVLTLVLGACASGAPSLAPTSASTVSSAPGPSGPCIDPGQLADSAESVGVALQGVVAALKVANTEQARSLAGTAATGMRSIAQFVGPVRPDAEKVLRGAADKLDGAASGFPDGRPLVDEVQKEFEVAYELARGSKCPA
jgi:hypothetical protein